MSGAVQGRRVQVRWSVGDGQIIQTAVKNDRSASSSRVCVCVCVCEFFQQLEEWIGKEHLQCKC